MAIKFCRHLASSTPNERYFNVPQIGDTGRHAEDFFALKNLTALAGFELAILGTGGQHANH
jgi:hypothetical protein